jgi:hypothetical protein
VAGEAVVRAEEKRRRGKREKTIPRGGEVSGGLAEVRRAKVKRRCAVPLVRVGQWHRGG